MIDTDTLRVFYDYDNTETFAVYRDGRLVVSSDESYTTLTELLAHFGVEVEHSDAFLIGYTDASIPSEFAADTIEQIEEWKRGEPERWRRADELDEQARQLLNEANRLRGGSSYD